MTKATPKLSPERLEEVRDGSESHNKKVDSSKSIDRSSEYREKYLGTYDGLEAYSSEGITKLEMLIERAKLAMDNAVPGTDGIRRGAAVLTKSDKVFTGCNIESQVESLRATAERTAVLKACSEGHADFAGMVLTNDAVEEDDTVSTVSGASRQFLAEFGDFPVYV